MKSPKFISSAIRTLFSTFGPVTANSPEVIKLLSDWQPTLTGIPVNHDTALNFSAVWAAVSFLSSQIASLPLIVYKQDGNRNDRDTTNRLYTLLHDEPNPETSSFTFREVLTAHLMLWGNAYAEIERDNAGRPIALWQLAPNMVEPFRNSSGELLYRVKGNPSGRDVILTPDDMIHVPGLGWDGTKGYSVIEKARESIALGLAMERFSAAFYGNGSTFGGVLSPTGGPLKEEQRKQLKDSIDKEHQGLTRAHRLLVLPAQMDIKQLGIPQKDAEFLSSRQFSVVEICRWFGVPPSKLQDLTHATFTNSEQQDLAFAKDRMRPLCVRFEQEYTRKLCSGPRCVEHLLDAVYRADAESRWKNYQIARQIGAMSTNEIRALENLNPIPNGDDYTPLFNGSVPGKPSANNA